MERDYLNEDKEFYPNTNGEISSSITQSWTEQAMECYSIGCDCRKCSLSKGNYSFVCQMPKVIDVLINMIGKPRIDMAQKLLFSIKADNFIICFLFVIEFCCDEEKDNNFYCGIYLHIQPRLCKCG